MSNLTSPNNPLLQEVRQLIDTAKQRTAVAINAEITQLYHQAQPISPNLDFRDPYILDFLGLTDTYSEYDLESAILADLQRFITELGSDFAFLARQKRITIDQRDYYIDRLFYHRRLKCLVAIDLKIGKFDAAFKGQMELHLRYLERYEKVEGEETPIGLILCTGKNAEHVEPWMVDRQSIQRRDRPRLRLTPPQNPQSQKGSI